jgi:hypothetical protein
MEVLNEIQSEIKRLESKKNDFKSQIDALKYFKEQFEMAENK